MQVSVFSIKQLETLIELAQNSERLRAHLCLHNSHQDRVQKVLIALTKGTYIPPHFHIKIHQWEHFQIIIGEVDLYIFDDEGMVRQIFKLGGLDGAIFAEIFPGTIHTLVCRSANAVVLEIKEGPFIEADAKFLPSWSYKEHYYIHSRKKIISMLEKLKFGDFFKI